MRARRPNGDARSRCETPTVCRKCSVHPAVLDSYLDGTMLETLRQRARDVMDDDLADLRPEEAAVLALLQRRLAREGRERRRAAR